MDDSTTVTTPLRERMVEFVQDLQNRIVSAVEAVDGEARFEEDRWRRSEGGGGITRVIEGGGIFEKGGVNTSVVHGPLPQTIAKHMGVESVDFFATGISLILHPYSPSIPTVHANYRYFEQSNGDAWFGGGCDLTPYRPDRSDAEHFHRTLREACAPHGAELYPAYKKACDEYFYLPHRGECRGIGGIFYDYLRGDHEQLEKTFEFHKDVGNAFLQAYLPIVERHQNDRWTERQKKYQLLRRGRYVEFNLVYDRGTRFGLETGGRIESILMSLPAVVNFDYDADMETNSEERELQSWLREPREWA